MVPLKNILPLTPPLRSRCHKPLAMNTEELLNILTYYHLQGFPLDENWFKPYKKTSTPVVLRLLPAACNVQLFSTRSMIEGWSSFCLCLLNFKKRLPQYFQTNMLILVIWLPLTVLLLIRSCPCTGRSIAETPIKPKCILALT